jgi:hypothetical protein
MIIKWAVVNGNPVCDEIKHETEKGDSLLPTYKTKEQMEYLNNLDPKRVVFDKTLEPVLVDIQERFPELQPAIKKRRLSPL